MININVSKICPFALAEEDGMSLYKIIIDAIDKNETVSVDFTGIDLFATPFFNTAFGAIILKIGVTKFDELVKIINLDKLGIETYQHSRNNAVTYLEKQDNPKLIEDAVIKNIKE